MMIEEEKYLIDKIGKENPFRVPDGYFEKVTSQVMARVDAEGMKRTPQAKTVWLRRPVYLAAACVCALFVSVSAYFAFQHNQDAEIQPLAVQQLDNSFDEAADYAMVDNMDIYACLSAEY